MVAKLEKRLKRIRFYEIICLTIIIAYLTLIILTTIFDKTVSSDLELGFTIGMTFSIIVYPIMYFGIWRNEVKQIEYLLYTGKEKYIEDISFEQKTFRKSNIYCGKYGFCKGKSGVPILYKNILWVYKAIQKMYGITVAQNFMIGLSNGERIQIQLREEEALRFLGEFVIPENPDVICGFSHDIEKRYNYLIKEIKQRGFDDWDRERFSNAYQNNSAEFYDEAIKDNIGGKKITLGMTILLTILLIGSLVCHVLSYRDIEDVVKDLKFVNVTEVESRGFYSLDEAKIIDGYAYRESSSLHEITNFYYIASYKDKNGKEYCFALNCPYDKDDEDNINNKYFEALLEGEIPLSGNFIASEGISYEEYFYERYNESIKDSGVTVAKFTLRFATKDEIEEEEEEQKREEETSVVSFSVLFGIFIIVSACCVMKKINKINRLKKMIDER